MSILVQGLTLKALFPIKRLRTIAAAALLVSAGLTGCTDTRRLDEAVFYQGPVFTLKVVRFYRNLFFSYNGETFSIQCSSEDTAGWGGNKFTEPGWYELGSGGAIGTKNADDVIEQVKAQCIIVNDSTLAMPGGVNPRQLLRLHPVQDLEPDDPAPRDDRSCRQARPLRAARGRRMPLLRLSRGPRARVRGYSGPPRGPCLVHRQDQDVQERRGPHGLKRRCRRDLEGRPHRTPLCQRT